MQNSLTSTSASALKNASCKVLVPCGVPACQNVKLALFFFLKSQKAGKEAPGSLAVANCKLVGLKRAGRNAWRDANNALHLRASVRTDQRKLENVVGQQLSQPAVQSGSTKSNVTALIIFVDFVRRSALGMLHKNRTGSSSPLELELGLAI